MCFTTALDGRGAFENEYAWLGVARGGRITRLELFEIEHLDAALARFEVLRPDPLAIPPNAASRAVDAQWAHWRAENWAALDALLQGGTYEDRRTLFKLAGGADLHLADLRHLHTTGLAPGRRLLATAGERLALEHMLWTAREEGAASEVELLRVTEIDADGRIAAFVATRSTPPRRVDPRSSLPRAARLSWPHTSGERVMARAKRFDYAIGIDETGRMFAEGGAAIDQGREWTPEHLVLAALGSRWILETASDHHQLEQGISQLEGTLEN